MSWHDPLLFQVFWRHGSFSKKFWTSGDTEQPQYQKWLPFCHFFSNRRFPSYFWVTMIKDKIYTVQHYCALGFGWNSETATAEYQLRQQCNAIGRQAQNLKTNFWGKLPHFKTDGHLELFPKFVCFVEDRLSLVNMYKRGVNLSSRLWLASEWTFLCHLNILSGTCCCRNAVKGFGKRPGTALASAKPRYALQLMIWN